MHANRADLNTSEQVWPHERAASPRSIPQMLEALALVFRYQRERRLSTGRVCRVLVPSCLGLGKAVRPSGRRASANR
jgi:hypothetical protein